MSSHTPILDCVAPLNNAYRPQAYTTCDKLRVREGSVTVLPKLREIETLELVSGFPHLGATFIVVNDAFDITKLTDMRGDFNSAVTLMPENEDGEWHVSMRDGVLHKEHVE